MRQEKVVSLMGLEMSTPPITLVACQDSMVRHKAVLFVCLVSVAANVYLLSRLKKPYHHAIPKSPGDITVVTPTGSVPKAQPEGKSLPARCPSQPSSKKRLESGGVSEELLDRAIAAFMGEIIVGHGVPSKYLCNKDPLLLQHMKHIARMFPKAKFLLMIRDGRAVAHSIVSRNITISGVDAKNYLSAALFWNKVALSMSEDCNNLPERCMIVFYEKLVGDPSTQMKEVLRFLDIPWHDNVLRHHEMIGSEVSLSK
eukprot:Em0201g9a